MALSLSTTICTLAALVGGIASPQSLKLDGHWQGVMERDGAVMTVRFDFQTGAAGVTGRFTSESQRAMEYPLDRVDYSASTIHLVLGGSLIFDGTVSPQAIAGTLKEGPGRGTFSLKPVSLNPLPYKREDVTFRVGDVTLAGTLLRPISAGVHPESFFSTEAVPRLDGEHRSFSRIASPEAAWQH
jgi:hypothetical protein